MRPGKKQCWSQLCLGAAILHTTPLHSQAEGTLALLFSWPHCYRRGTCTCRMKRDTEGEERREEWVCPAHWLALKHRGVHCKTTHFTQLCSPPLPSLPPPSPSPLPLPISPPPPLPSLLSPCLSSFESARLGWWRTTRRATSTVTSAVWYMRSDFKT